MNDKSISLPLKNTEMGVDKENVEKLPEVTNEINDLFNFSKY